MFISFSRVVVLAVLYLNVLTSAVPVVQDGTEVSINSGSGLVVADHDGHAVELDARARTTRPKAKPVKKPVKAKTPVKTPIPIRKPTPTKTTVRKPTPIKTSSRKPVVTRTSAKPVVTRTSAKPVVTKPVVTRTSAKPVVTRTSAKPVVTRTSAKPVVTRTSAKPIPTTKRPTPAKPTTPVKRPTTAPKPPSKPTKPATPKPTTTKAPVKTTSKPTPKPTKPPVNAPKPAKPTKTTSKTPTPTPTKPPQCPPPKKGKGSKSPRALFEWAVGLFKRDNAEFIGWHGTNSKTAELWKEKGYLANPKTVGWPWGSSGTSGADHELGPGVYITDEMETARGFANTNANANPGTTPMLCAIFARSSNAWKNSVNKVWLPTNLIRDASDAVLSATYEKQRNEWIGRVIPHSTGKDVARFAPLDKNRGGPPNQVVIPSALTGNLYAVCVPAFSGQIPLGANTRINYSVERHPWNVRDKPCAQ